MRRASLLLFVVAFLLLSNGSPALAQDQIRLYYAGNSDRVLPALQVAAEFEFVEDPLQADVLVLNGVIPDLESIQESVVNGAGLVLILSPEITSRQVETLFGFPVSLEINSEPLSLSPAENTDDPLLDAIVWNSAPQIRQRLTPLEIDGDLVPLITGFEQKELILGKQERNGSVSFLLTTVLAGENKPFQDWAYFNYLMYSLALRSASREPLSFSQYPGSPVPHTADRLVLLLFLAVIIILAILIFWLVRKYSLRHPEALDELITDREDFKARQESTDWHYVGFHRPLAGFMLTLMLGLLLFVPLIIYQNLILPVYILPSAQALGIWGRVTQLFNLVWLLFDMGTSSAFIKFFAQYRVHDPRRAIQYGQVFVWWQAISGAVQVAIVTALASTLAADSVYALYAWSIILHTLVQIPGFYQVFRHALMGWQRFDYAQIVYLGLYLIFPILVQPVVVIGMVAWGKTNPVFGGSMGGLLGLGISAYVIEALTFLMGWWLYTRLGYNARLLFLAHFDWKTIRSAFQFGVFEMLGSVAWAIGQAMEILITQTRLVNYTEVWGNWILANNFVFAYSAMQTLYENLMPSISEAFSHARIALSQYYSVMAYKWGGLISAFIAAVLLAVGDRFILGASGPEFSRAAVYAIPLILWGAFQYPSWVGDIIQLGTGKPYLKSLLVGGEQIIRILLAWILLARFQINALIIAYFIGLFAKDIAAYWINHKFCFPQRFFFWQSLGAPLLAGLTHYLILRWATGYLWKGDQVTSVLIVFAGILFSYPLYVFLYGLYGGWDEANLLEVRHAARLSSFMRPFAMLFWAATSLGARLSPLHNRFPITLRNAALAEAASLTQEKVKL